ncbi:unnamed protein product [Ectocarpus sp. 6 AP-2014]
MQISANTHILQHRELKYLSPLFFIYANQPNRVVIQNGQQKLTYDEEVNCQQSKPPPHHPILVSAQRSIPLRLWHSRTTFRGNSTTSSRRRAQKTLRRTEDTSRLESKPCNSHELPALTPQNRRSSRFVPPNWAGR